MFPPVFQLINTESVRAIVGDAPVRIYDFGFAHQSVEGAYITFSQVACLPYEQISGVPCGDFDSVQLDLYSSDRGEVRELARLVRQCLDGAGVSCRVNMQTYEPDSGLYRISINADFISV